MLPLDFRSASAGEPSADQLSLGRSSPYIEYIENIVVWDDGRFPIAENLDGAVGEDDVDDVDGDGELKSCSNGVGGTRWSCGASIQVENK